MGDTEPDLNKIITEAGWERRTSSTWEELRYSLAPVRPELQEGEEWLNIKKTLV